VPRDSFSSPSLILITEGAGCAQPLFHPSLWCIVSDGVLLAKTDYSNRNRVEREHGSGGAQLKRQPVKKNVRPIATTASKNSLDAWLDVI
jgi:hypothetical protein